MAALIINIVQKLTGKVIGMKGRRSLSRQDVRWGYLFVLPQVVGLAVFIVFPLIMSVYLCFSKWDMIEPPQFIGLKNFSSVFVEDGKIFWTSITNTLILIGVTVPLTLIVSLLLAQLCNRRIRGVGFYKAAFFLPMVTSPVSIALVWFWLYAPDFGLINGTLSLFGINGPGWLTDMFWSKVAIIIMSIWMKVGYYFILFFAGLKGIPTTYYEAAQLDGASQIQIFLKITLPLLSPVTFFCVVNLCIDFFNLFDVPFVLTRGGPAYSTYTLVMYVYNQAFQFFKMGEAAVSSLVLFIVVAVITLVMFKISEKVVVYDAQQ